MKNNILTNTGLVLLLMLLVVCLLNGWGGMLNECFKDVSGIYFGVGFYWVVALHNFSYYWTCSFIIKVCMVTSGYCICYFVV